MGALGRQVRHVTAAAPSDAVRRQDSVRGGSRAAACPAREGAHEPLGRCPQRRPHRRATCRSDPTRIAQPARHGEDAPACPSGGASCRGAAPPPRCLEQKAGQRGSRRGWRPSRGMRHRWRQALVPSPRCTRPRSRRRDSRGPCPRRRGIGTPCRGPAATACGRHVHRGRGTERQRLHSARAAQRGAEIPPPRWRLPLKLRQARPSARRRRCHPPRAAAGVVPCWRPEPCYHRQLPGPRRPQHRRQLREQRRQVGELARPRELRAVGPRDEARWSHRPLLRDPRQERVRDGVRVEERKAPHGPPLRIPAP